MRDCLVVIPSRLGSTRFPGKVLAKLGGRAIVEWCWRAATAAGVGPVLVATESPAVADAVRAFGGKAVLTSASCRSGSDRVFEAARGSRAPFVINLQGDMPLVRPSTLRRVAELLRRRPKADIATAVIPLRDKVRLRDPNAVKAALDGERALYFSRAPIPYPRDPRSAKTYEHLGVYGFRREALKRFVKLKPSALEKAESLEQLRALGDGMTIVAAIVADRPVSIDTPADLRRAEALLKSSRRGTR